jgi:hypothetical protein
MERCSNQCPSTFTTICSLARIVTSGQVSYGISQKPSRRNTNFFQCLGLHVTWRYLSHCYPCRRASGSIIHEAWRARPTFCREWTGKASRIPAAAFPRTLTLAHLTRAAHDNSEHSQPAELHPGTRSLPSPSLALREQLTSRHPFEITLVQ